MKIWYLVWNIIIDENVTVEKFYPIEYLIWKRHIFIEDCLDMLEVYGEDQFWLVAYFDEEFWEPNELVSYGGQSE